MSRRGLIATCVLAVFALALVVSTAATQASQDQKHAKAQEVKLTADGSTYVLTPSTLTKGVPVKIDVDLKTVKGCMTTVVISAFNVKKTVKEGDATIELTPNKAGKFDIVCGMNMGKGSFTVVEPASSK